MPMIVETIQLIENALNNTTYGVNTFLTSKALPIVQGVYTEIDSYWVCVGGEPKSFPVIVVTLANDVEYTMPEIRTSIRDVQIPIAISYWNKLEETNTGASLGYQSVAAIMNTLRQWTKNENAADRISGNIQIVEMVSIRQTPRNVSQDQDVNVLMSLIITFRVRDVAP